MYLHFCVKPNFFDESQNFEWGHCIKYFPETMALIKVISSGIEVSTMQKQMFYCDLCVAWHTEWRLLAIEEVTMGIKSMTYLQSGQNNTVSPGETVWFVGCKCTLYAV